MKRAKDWLDVVGFLAFLGWTILCGGACASTKDALTEREDARQATECMRQGDMLIQSSLSCQQAIGALHELVERSPECGHIFGDGGALRLVCDAPDGGRE